MLFSERIGLYAAFMLAANPVSILTSYKLWADDMVAVFVALSVLLFIISKNKEKIWISFIAGLSCGIAVLTKQNAGLIFGGIILYSVWLKRDLLKDIKKWHLLIFDKHLIWYTIGLVIFAGPWFYIIFTVEEAPVELWKMPLIALRVRTTDNF